MRGEVFRLKFKQEMPLRHMCVVTGGVQPDFRAWAQAVRYDGLRSGRRLSRPAADDRKMSLLQKKNISNPYGKHNK